MSVRRTIYNVHYFHSLFFSSSPLCTTSVFVCALCMWVFEYTDSYVELSLCKTVVILHLLSCDQAAGISFCRSDCLSSCATSTIQSHRYAKSQMSHLYRQTLSRSQFIMNDVFVILLIPHSGRWQYVLIIGENRVQG